MMNLKQSMKKVYEGVRKKLPLIGLCAGIVAFSFWSLWTHYGVAGKLVGDPDIVTRAENWLLDYRFEKRGPLKESGKVGILAIDEATLQYFDRWPINRNVYEKALKNLKEIGVEWIGMDVVWAEPEEPFLTDVRENIEAIKKAPKSQISEVVSRELAAIDSAMIAGKGDKSLAKMVADIPELVLGYFYYILDSEAEALGDKKFDGLEPMLASEVPEDFILIPGDLNLDHYKNLKTPKGIVANTDFIAENAENFGFFSNETDDSVTRWNVAVRNINGHLMPSLSLKMASNILGSIPLVTLDDRGVEKIDLINMEDDSQYVTVPTDQYGHGKILINHLGMSETIPHFSLAKAFKNDFTEEERAQLKGRSLLLGPTAVAINDQRPNPFDPAINGVENHAAVIDNILSGRYMSRTPEIYKTELAIVLGIGLLFGPIMIWGKAAFSGIAAVLFVIGYYFFDKYFWFGRGQWVYMGMPFLEITSLFVGTTLYKYAIEEREKRKIKGQFGAYVSPDLVKMMEDDPEAMKVGGRKQDLTVFFSDVRDFTSMSENLEPEKLVELMNLYFEPMTALIQDSKGTIDKFIGDAIMAFWGAPVQFDDHPDRAVGASLKMLFELDKLREDFTKKGLPIIDIGIGLNSGPMVVGNIGTDKIKGYTVMGDSVNLGARLEGMTKEYGVKLMISEFTQARLTEGLFITRDLDKIQVKGKDKPVTVFEVMRPDILREQQFKDFLGLWDEGRKAYAAQEWVKAEKAFLQCELIKPDDKATKNFIERIEAFKGHDFDPNWNGVKKYTTK